MAPKLNDIKTGNIGFFWPQSDFSLNLSENEKERGYLKQEYSETAYIRTLEEDPASRFFSRGERPTLTRPTAIAAQLEDGGLLALDLAGKATSTRIGGTRASVNRYRARVLISNAPLTELRSSLLHGVSVHFPGISSWIGSETNSVKTDNREDGRQRGVTIKVSSPEPLKLDIGDGLELELGMHWQLDGADDRRTLYAPFSIGVGSSTPMEVLDLLEPLILVQDLLNVAHRGFMRGDGGRAKLDVERTPARSPELWSHQLMEFPLGARAPRSATELPMFSLATIGGARAVPRWIELAREHPRLLEPIVDRFRYGTPTIGTYLRDLGAAIDYWRAANSRASWASDKPQSLAVANSLGEPFAAWLGVPVKDWADRLWTAYTSSKHLISRSTAREEDAETLAMSAR